MVQELRHLPADLQLAEMAVQVDTVQAFEVQPDMPVQHIVHRDRHRPPQPRRHDTLPNVAYERRMRLPAREHQRRPGTLAVSGGACLGRL
jgi:hypothetical protein